MNLPPHASIRDSLTTLASRKPPLLAFSPHPKLGRIGQVRLAEAGWKLVAEFLELMR